MFLEFIKSLFSLFSIILLIPFGITVIIVYLYSAYIYFKTHKVLKLYSLYPRGVKLVIIQSNAPFKERQKFLFHTINNKELLEESHIDIANIKKLSLSTCDFVKKFPKEQLIQWDKDYNYVKQICDKYKEAIYYYVMSVGDPTVSLSEKDKDSIYWCIKNLNFDYLHELALISEEKYKQMQIEEEEKFNLKYKKADYQAILDYLKKNNINCVYHFTDSKNLASIIKNGGLYSWYSCSKKGIHIKNPGGNRLSRKLDSRKGLEDYVHLCFHILHPMCIKKEMEAACMTPPGYIIMLKIHPAVFLLKSTLFSTENATNNTTIIGGDASTLNLIDCKIFGSYDKSSLYDYDEKYREKYRKNQAEILVRTFIPLKYIINIPESERLVKIHNKVIE